MARNSGKTVWTTNSHKIPCPDEAGDSLDIDDGHLGRLMGSGVLFGRCLTLGGRRPCLHLMRPRYQGHVHQLTRGRFDGAPPSPSETSSSSPELASKPATSLPEPPTTPCGGAVSDKMFVTVAPPTSSAGVASGVFGCAAVPGGPQHRPLQS